MYSDAATCKIANYREPGGLGERSAPNLVGNKLRSIGGKGLLLGNAIQNVFNLGNRNVGSLVGNGATSHR